EARGLALGTCQGVIPEAADPALRGDESSARLGKVDERLALGVLHHCTNGHREHQVLTVGARTIISRAVTAVLCVPVRPAMIIEQRGHLRIGDNDNVSAVATRSPVGTGKRLELLPPN